MKNIILPIVLLLGIALAAQTPFSSFSKFNFTKLESHQGEATVTPLGENAFRMTLKNTQKNNHAIALANFRYDAAAQQKLVFRMKSKSRSNAFLTVVLLHERQGKLISSIGSQIRCNSTEFKRYVFSLDQDFKLGDGVYSLRQIKFVLNGAGNPKGSVAEIEVSGVRIVNADEVSVSSSASGFLIVPAASPKTVEKKGILVWLEFDNDDLSTLRKSRVSPGKITDPLPDAGYRNLLLEHTDGLFHMADSPESADVIVYSRASVGENALRIASAVRQGKRLIVYGTPADGEVRALLPGTLNPVRQNGFPERKKLKVVKSVHPLLKNMDLTDARFAVYADLSCPKENVVLEFEGGVPYLSAKGNVLHFNGGIGTVLDLKKTNFYDRTFLRAAALHSARTLEGLDRRDREISATEKASDDAILDSAGIPASERGNWQVGRSKNNFGRFGWLIGEPLPAGTVSRDLTVSLGAQSYRFDTGGFTTSPLRNWSRKPMSGSVTFQTKEPENDVNPCALWDGLGVVEYSCEKNMDPDWKNKKISFLVKNGIDDCDEVYFNGTLIGKTDKSTPYYWMVERNYPVPQNLIRWDGPNRIVMRMENLNGSSACGSRPELRIDSGAKRAELSVGRIDWTGKEFRILDASGTRTMALSLLTPFIHFTFPGNSVFFGQENLAEFASFQTASGVKTVPLNQNGGAFYEKKRSGAWTAPWLLLYRKKDARPLLLVFSRQPESLTARISDGVVEGFSIRGMKNNIELSVGWPWGVRVFENGLPSDAPAQIERALSFALNRPVACDEVFQIDRKNKLVHVVQSFRFERIADEWNTPVRKFVFLPPLTGYMSSRKNYVKTNEDLANFGIDTELGPTLGKMDSSRITFTLPLPDPDRDLLPAGVEHKTINAAQNKNFAGGVRWSCGGLTPVSVWTAEHPQGKGISLKNIDLFAWNFGLTTALQGAWFLTPENRSKLENRVRARFVEPLDLYQYKSAFIHRQEPFSGLRYPVAFNSFYPIGAEYAPGMGSQVVYGDSNEACSVVVWLARQLADQHGQSGMARANWNFFRYIMRYQEMIDDYAFSAGSCRETGVGAWVDMLNGEYSGMLDYARLAKLVGDRDTENQALYRAAVRGIPTLARLFFSDYYESIHPEDKGKTDYQITGFGEDGAKLMRFPTKSGNFRAANDLFDFSQGLPGSLYHLYQSYALPQIREHFKLRALPLLSKDKAIDFSYLQPLAMFDEKENRIVDAEQSVRTFDRTRDWPGIRVPFELGLVLWRANGRIALEVCKNANVRTMRFHPESKRLDMEFIAEPDAEFILASDTVPKRAILNGKEKRILRTDSGIHLPFVPGRNSLQLFY